MLLFFSGIKGCHNPEDYVEFRKLPREQQRTRFKQLPPQKQIDFYLLSMGHEPADMTFDEDLASQGRAILPTLLERLKVEPEYQQRKLLWAIEVMHRKFVPLNEDKALLDDLQQVVSRMKDPDWKQASQKSFDVIRAKPDAPGPRPRTFP